MNLLRIFWEVSKHHIFILVGTAESTRPNPKQFDKKKFVTCVLSNN